MEGALWLSRSGSGVGGNAPQRSLGFVGCDVKGPPPGVGGRPALLAGDSGGESGVAEAFASAVEEQYTGWTESGM